MKKFMVLVLAALSLGTVCAAGTDMYLCWMIDENATFTDQRGEAVDTSGMMARVYATNDGGEKYLLGLCDTDLEVFGTGVEISEVQGYDILANVTAYYGDGYSYFIELVGDIAQLRSESLDYSAVSEYFSSMRGMAQPPLPYGFATFTGRVAPEPTSGLLVLLGVAGLALRRKNVRKA